jgi:acyl CoA:acetate/3-ketoacid CoA transferase alpha subunit
MKSSNLNDLVQDAVACREASASNGKWVALLVQGDPVFDREMMVEVWHHGTLMFACRMGCTGLPSTHGVFPVDSGHGSTSDRCGVRRITAGAYEDDGVGYKELYEGSAT